MQGRVTTAVPTSGAGVSGPPERDKGELSQVRDRVGAVVDNVNEVRTRLEVLADRLLGCSAVATGGQPDPSPSPESALEALNLEVDRCRLGLSVVMEELMRLESL